MIYQPLMTIATKKLLQEVQKLLQEVDSTRIHLHNLVKITSLTTYNKKHYEHTKTQC